MAPRDVARGGGSGDVASGGPPPMAVQWALGWGFGQVYNVAVAPHVRDLVNRATGVKDSPSFRPPLTPGWMLRDLVQAGVGQVLGQGVFRRVMSAIGTPAGGNNLVSAAGNAGMLGANAGAALLATTAAMTLLSTVLDQVFARNMGRYVEQPVNRAFGITKSTDIKDPKGNAPQSAIKQTLETGTRQATVNFLGMLSQGLAWNAVGSGIARIVATGMGGPVGAVVGALGGMVAASVVSHGIMWSIAQPTANAATRGVRALKRGLGMKLDPESGAAALQQTPGDRIAGNLGSVIVPAATAGMTRQMGAFTAGLVPAGR